MEKLVATLALELDKRREKVDKTYPVKLMVTYNRKFKRYATGFCFTEADYKEVCKINPKGKYKDMHLKLKAIESKALLIIKELEEFRYETFEKKFLVNKSEWDNVYALFDYEIEKMRLDGRISTADSYMYAKNSFLEKMVKKHIKFRDITVGFLQEYERKMLLDKMSPTTIGIYMRCLRRIYNVAIFNGAAKRDNYPFGAKANNLYQPPTHRNIKKAIDIIDIKKIFDYSSKNEVEMYYKDLWLFSYFCSGMNMVDILNLKYKHIKNDSIIFVRKKTHRSRRTTDIIIYLSEFAQRIIDTWGSKPKDEANYIFKGFEEGMLPEKMYKNKLQEIKQCNKYIKMVAEKIGIDKTITTYVARHSFATILKDSNEPIALISESLGHSSIAVTENYLKSFQLDKRKRAAQKLTDWVVIPPVKKEEVSENEVEVKVEKTKKTKSKIKN